MRDREKYLSDAPRTKGSVKVVPPIFLFPLSLSSGGRCARQKRKRKEKDYEGTENDLTTVVLVQRAMNAAPLRALCNPASG